MDVVKVLSAFRKLDDVQRDNAVFKLHYRFTVMLLVVFSILVSTKQYFGDPIKCDISSTSSIQAQTVETFCWIYGTYTLPITANDPYTPGLGNEVGREQTWHLYYQWVAVVLLLQAFFFYLPYYLWNVWEGGRMAKLVKDLDGPLVPPVWNENTKKELTYYLINSAYLHSLYAYRYVLCELLNFINVVFQFLFTNWLLKGQYLLYGTAFLNVNSLNENSFSSIFPKTTKCKYRNFGPSGGSQSYDFLCILPLNILNEKLYLILWFWMFFLVVVSFIMITYRLLVVFCPKLRTYVLFVQIRNYDMRHLEKMVNSMNYGGFFVLHMIGKNCHPFVLKELLTALYERIKFPHNYINDAISNNNDVIIV